MSKPALVVIQSVSPWGCAPIHAPAGPAKAHAMAYANSHAKAPAQLMQQP
jgi:hypothetical protein